MMLCDNALVDIRGNMTELDPVLDLCMALLGATKDGFKRGKTHEPCFTHYVIAPKGLFLLHLHYRGTVPPSAKTLPPINTRSFIREWLIAGDFTEIELDQEEQRLDDPPDIISRRGFRVQYINAELYFRPCWAWLGR